MLLTRHRLKVSRKMPNVISLKLHNHEERGCDAELEEERNPECEQQTRRQLLVTSPLQTNDTEP